MTISTNNLAKELSPHNGIVVLLAKTQTHGRGQFQRSWDNATQSEGQLLVTYSEFYDIAPQPHLTSAIGASLHKSLSRTWPDLPLKLKMPNDLYCLNKKCGGLLVEVVSSGSRFQLIIGLGLNITSYPKGVEIAGALFSTSAEISYRSWTNFLSLWEAERAQALITNWEKITEEYSDYLERYRM